jgi:hypothetical protein
MSGIHAGSPLKSLINRHTRSIGAFMTVLTCTFAIAGLPIGASTSMV